MANLERPHHGWEGISNGGEIYGNQIGTSKEDRKKEYLQLVKLSLETSMSNEPNAYEKSKEIMRYAKQKYSDLLDDEIDCEYQLQGDGSEIESLLAGVVTDEELEVSNFKK